MARPPRLLPRGGATRARPARALLLRAGRLARAATAPVRERMDAWRARREPATLALVDVRRRLELLVTALHGRPIAIVGMKPQRGPGAIARLLGVQPLPPILPATDGERIRLPAFVDAAAGEPAALARYRLLALAQAERIARGTTAAAPPDLAFDPRRRLARELYVIAEGAATDAALGARVAGLRDALAAARREALAARPPLAQLPPVEREVERLVRQALGEPAGHVPAIDGAPALRLPAGATPEATRAWAEDVATRLRRLSRGYGGVPDIPHWGTLLAAGIATGDDGAELPTGTTRGPRSNVVGRTRTSGDGDTTGGEGTLERPDAKEARAPDAPGEAVPDLRTPAGAPQDPVDAASRVTRPPMEPDSAVLASYGEWDDALGREVARAVAVRERVARDGSAAWVTTALGSHAALVWRVRERFERMRARRLRVPRQREGDELDMDAVARALVDRRLGLAMDDRLWVNVNPGRRGMAIALLVDVSGSTETRVTLEQRVIDVEREAVLLASEAFEALGDRYGIFSFSGRGARDVRIGTLKAFGERNGDAVRRRIAGIAPDGNTRLGAAMRHASALLAHESAGHRLLLIVSDGRPNDTDRYFEQYAVEDSRAAVLAARATGIHVFCLTVDRAEGEDYLPRIFGAKGFTILRHPAQLPRALLGVARQMLVGRSH